MIHFHKQLVQRIHLIGVSVGQQFLHIVKEQDSASCILHVLFPLIHKPLIIHGVNYRQLGFGDDAVLVEIILEDFGQLCLSGTSLTHDDGIDAQPHVHHVFA